VDLTPAHLELLRMLEEAPCSEQTLGLTDTQRSALSELNYHGYVEFDTPPRDGGPQTIWKLTVTGADAIGATPYHLR
jgi:hypothetical protein